MIIITRTSIAVVLSLPIIPAVVTNAQFAKTLAIAESHCNMYDTVHSDITHMAE